MAQPTAEETESMRNLMVNYIPSTVDELQLRQLFEQYGPIETVKIVCDRESRQSRGYGFVKYVEASSANQAIQELNGYAIMNKRLKVSLAAAGHRKQPNQNQQQGMTGGFPATPYGAYGGYPYAAAQMQQQMMAMQQYQQYQQYLAMQAAAQRH